MINILEASSKNVLYWNQFIKHVYTAEISWRWSLIFVTNFSLLVSVNIEASEGFQNLVQITQVGNNIKIWLRWILNQTLPKLTYD